MEDPSCNGASRINCFALVTYIPGPLGEFLDELRRTLEPNSLKPRAHVTVLPPRCLADPSKPEMAWDQLRGKIPHFQPFPIEVGPSEIFPGTNVVYFSLRRGWEELLKMHRDLCGGVLSYCEPFPYHPHITVAQKLSSDDAVRIQQESQRRWAEYRGPRTFYAETFTFVQNSATDRWYDLAELTLPSPVGVD